MNVATRLVRSQTHISARTEYHLRSATREGEGAAVGPRRQPPVRRHRAVRVDQHDAALRHRQLRDGDVGPARPRNTVVHWTWLLEPSAWAALFAASLMCFLYLPARPCSSTATSGMVTGSKPRNIDDGTVHSNGGSRRRSLPWLVLCAAARRYASRSPSILALMVCSIVLQCTIGIFSQDFIKDFRP